MFLSCMVYSSIEVVVSFHLLIYGIISSFHSFIYPCVMYGGCYRGYGSNVPYNPIMGLSLCYGDYSPLS